MSPEKPVELKRKVGRPKTDLNISSSERVARIFEAIGRLNGNIAAAARELNMTRQNLHILIRRNPKLLEHYRQLYEARNWKKEVFRKIGGFEGAIRLAAIEKYSGDLAAAAKELDTSYNSMYDWVYHNPELKTWLLRLQSENKSGLITKKKWWGRLERLLVIEHNSGNITAAARDLKLTPNAIVGWINRNPEIAKWYERLMFENLWNQGTPNADTIQKYKSVIVECCGKIGLAAKILGLKRSTLRKAVRSGYLSKWYEEMTHKNNWPRYNADQIDKYSYIDGLPILRLVSQEEAMNYYTKYLDYYKNNYGVDTQTGIKISPLLRFERYKSDFEDIQQVYSYAIVDALAKWDKKMDLDKLVLDSLIYYVKDYFRQERGYNSKLVHLDPEIAQIVQIKKESGRVVTTRKKD